MERRSSITDAISREKTSRDCKGATFSSRHDRSLTVAARSKHSRAFTLAESLIASVVLAAAVIGISGTLSATYQQSESQGESTTALDLGRELMEEIASKQLDPPSGSTNQSGWTSGNTDRTTYDTVDDYDGYTDTSTSIKTRNGSTIDTTSGQTYARTVSVQSNAVPSGLTGTAADFMLVKITVTTPHGRTIYLSQLMTRVNVQR